MNDYFVKSPVLLLAFNRPDITLQVFNAIRAVKPKRLYMAVDGPRNNNGSDIDLCGQVRDMVQLVDWDCTVSTRFGNNNLGCKLAVSGAINWFFELEEEGIILEDDCLPATSFFYFCDELLEKYRTDTRIHNITGTNLQKGLLRGHASYYFSQYSNVWGWASWRRVWQKYDAALLKYSAKEVEAQLANVFNDRFLVAEWVWVFNELKHGNIDTWDYQLNFITFFENALCATPNTNLVSNIGFRADATHTDNPANHNANLPTGEINNLTHPVYFLPDKEADYFFLRQEFELDKKWARYNKRTKRFKRWLASLKK